MNKRNFAALVAGVALLAAGMLAGCGDKTADAPADGAAAPGATTTAPAGGKMDASPAAGGKMNASPAAPPGPATK